MSALKSSQLLQAILIVRIDPKEADSLVLISCGHLTQYAGVLFGQRALDTEKADHQDFAVGKRFESPRLTCGIGQRRKSIPEDRLKLASLLRVALAPDRQATADSKA
jgi:hypothetical protein